jgi:RNA polymerase sigma factor (TIGR02999 family)
VYEELREVARGWMRGRPAEATLHPTALVHEAYLRLAHGGERLRPDRRYFFAAAGRAMRRILVESARRRQARRRGGGRRRLSLDRESDPSLAVDSPIDASIDLAALDSALERFEANEKHRRKCEIVHLRFFVGLSNEEIADTLGISLATVKRDWAFAQAWLHAELEDPVDPA